MSDINNLAKESYYMNANMIEFLIKENLALKSLLHEKGIINPEEFKKHQTEASDLVDKRVSDQIEDWKNSNPKIYEILKNMQEKSSTNITHSKDASVVS